MSLKNILSLKKLYFLKPSLDSKYSLTQLSQQIKQNIANEWIKSNRSALSLQMFANPFFQIENSSKTESLKNVMDNYKSEYGHWINDWSDNTSQPMGIIQRFLFSNDSKSKSFIDQNKSDFLVFALICGKHQSLHLFQKMQTFHNHWFRNLSKSPLKCGYDLVQNTDNNLHFSVNYNIEESNEKLEELVYFRDSSVEKEFGLTDCDLISCHLNLDNTLLSFLCDAFNQTTHKNGNVVKKMKLNSRLSPLKIGFTFRDNTEINDQMIEIVKYLIETLKGFEIPILPFFANNPIGIESCDELGIPFTVIVDKDSNRTGIFALRNRDTDIEEWVHISNFQKTVCLYLGVIHPSIVQKSQNI